MLGVARQRIIEETLEHLDAVPPGASHGGVVELRREHPRRGLGRGQHDRDRTDARTEIDGDPPRREHRRRPSCQRLGLSSRNVDARCNEQADVAERDRTCEPRDRLTVDTTRDQVIEGIGVITGCAHELSGFLPGIDAARLDQSPRYRGEIEPTHPPSPAATVAGEDALSPGPSMWRRRPHCPRRRPGFTGRVSPRRILPDESVHGLPDEIRMADMPRVLLDQVDQDAPQAG